MKRVNLRIFGLCLIGLIGGSSGAYLTKHSANSNISNKKQELSNHYLRLFSLCLLGLIASCGDPSPSPDPPPPTNKNVPIAHITLDHTTIELGQSVNISALESSDLDGNSLFYQWSVKHENGQDASLANKHAEVFDFTPQEFGSYQVTLTVSDDDYTSEAIHATIAVEPNAQSFPVAIASGSINNKVGQTHWLSAEKSTAGTGQLLSYQWTFTSKPTSSNSSIGEATSLQAYFIADKAGIYEISLTVTNIENQLTAQDDFIVNMDDLLTNSPPQAWISVARINYAVNEVVKLNGTDSYDSDNDQLSYNWRFEQKPVASNAQIAEEHSEFIEFIADTEGDYEVILTVSDGQLTSEQKQIIQVTHQNISPIANAGSDQVVVFGLPVELNGAASSDADGETLQYQWSLISRPAASNYNELSEPELVDSSRFVFIPDEVGEFFFGLNVNDGIGYSLTDHVRITVTENQRPIASLPGDIIVNHAENTFIFDHGSYDPEGLPLTYYWQLTQAPEGYEGSLVDPQGTAYTSLNITLPGTYTIQLIVNDGMQYSIPETTTIVYIAEEWIELTVTGQLVDEAATPLADIEIGGILQAKVHTDTNGYFEIQLKSKEQDARLEYLRMLADNIPAIFLSLGETNETSLNLGTVTLPVMQQRSILLQACQGYTGPTQLTTYFSQLNSGFEDMQFPITIVAEFGVDQAPQELVLPAPAEINVRPSPEIQVELTIEDELPFFINHYQLEGEQAAPLVIKVCN